MHGIYIPHNGGSIEYTVSFSELSFRKHQAKEYLDKQNADHSRT